MNVKQSSLKGPIVISGIGLHSGIDVAVRILPAPENHGFKFQRIDLPGQPIIPADVELVVDVSRGTTIEKNGARVSTIEHCLAALAGLQIDNALIELNAQELPILDGSARPYIDAIRKVGILEQEAEREYFDIPDNITFSDPERKVEMVAMPYENGIRMTVMIDYNSPVLGSQHASITSMKEFETQLADSRTFCFLHELEQLLSADLIKGGDLNNAIVIVDKVVNQEELNHLAKLFNKSSIEVKEEGILNNVELHYQNEPARHKLLDLIGDLALIGVPIRGHIMAARPGHASNVEFAQKLKDVYKTMKKRKNAPRYDPNATPIYNTIDIMNILPHTDPFLLVDKIIELSDRHVVGIKNVTVDQPFFRGHFPGNPILPGVLQIESMAQTGGVMMLSNVDNPKNYNTLFMKIDNCKFKEMVVPGDTMIIKAELMAPVRRGICSMKCQIFVGNKVVTEAELMAQIVKKS